MFLSPLRKTFNQRSHTAKSPAMNPQNRESSDGSIDWKLYSNPHYSFKPVSKSNPGTISDLQNEVKVLKAELEHEKRMRRKAEEVGEKLMKELVEERKGREGVNEACGGLIRDNLPVGKVIKMNCVENPHIKRGISGVEFFRATRAKRSFVKCREGGANLECQRAQLRVLMRYKSSVGNVGNLVM